MIDFDETCTHVMDMIAFNFYFIGLAKERNLEMCLMDVLTTYLYISLDINTFMKTLKGLKLF